MYLEKNVLVKNIFTNELKKSLQLWAWVEKIVEVHWLSSKEIFEAQWSVKKAMQSLFLNMKGTITIYFFEKSATINSATYYQFLGQNPPYFWYDTCMCMCIYIYLYIYIYIYFCFLFYIRLGDLENVEYPFIAIASSSILTWSDSTW